MTQTCQENCYYGQIAFKVAGELAGATDGNCAICQRKGTLR